MVHLLEKDHLKQGDMVQYDTSQEHLNNVGTIVNPYEYADPMYDLQIADKYGEKEVLTGMINDITGGMIRGFEDRLFALVQTVLESTLEGMITEILTDDHHRNPLRESIKDFLRSPQASHFLENALMKTDWSRKVSQHT